MSELTFGQQVRLVLDYLYDNNGVSGDKLMKFMKKSMTFDEANHVADILMDSECLEIKLHYYLTDVAIKQISEFRAKEMR